MGNEFNFKSNIKDVQNSLITQSIRDSSNIQLLKSEEAIQQVIKSYSDRFKTVNGLLTSAVEYVVKSKDVIRTDQFNNLFESVYIDLSALYNDLELVDNILNLNLMRNKSFFQTIKKRIKDLWNRLYLTRSNIFDNNPGDESYYESFNTEVSFDKSVNIVVDKKIGVIYLEPVNRRVNNDAYLIKSINSIVYPVDNPDGGVIVTTDTLNSINDNYSAEGAKDMLQNGLWKEELLCQDVPNLSVNIGSEDVKIYKNFKGVVSVLDIEFTYPVEINRYDFDIFGEASLAITNILYKDTDLSNWTNVEFQKNDISITNPNEIVKNIAQGEGFDVVSLMNVVKHKVKYLRIVFNQKNYFLLNKDNSITIADSIQTDLSERRYELAKFGLSLDDSLSTPVVDKNISVYNQIIQVIETTKSTSLMLRKIEEILIPEIRVITKDFSKFSKFELGTWSIEPILEKYTSSEGIYNSKPYSLNDRSLLSVSVKTGQTTPDTTTCNWYVGIKDVNVPIIENNTIVRKEPFNVIDMGSYYPSFSGWPGTFIQLDFPVNPELISLIGYYKNGEFFENVSDDILYLNSTIIYFKTITNPRSANYVIRYPSSTHTSVNLYTLMPKSGAIGHIPLGIVASRRFALDYFIHSNSSILSINSKPLSELYDIVSVTATFEESKKWFIGEYGVTNESFNSCLYIANELLSLFDSTDVLYNDYIISSVSKLNTFYNYGDPEYFDLLSSLTNIVPIRNTRRL